MALFRGSVDGRWGEGITRQTKGSGVREENQPTIEEREIVRYNAASRAENEGVEREGAHDIARGVWGGSGGKEKEILQSRSGRGYSPPTALRHSVGPPHFLYHSPLVQIANEWMHDNCNTRFPSSISSPRDRFFRDDGDGVSP
jgi:hypothetical protein